MRIPLMGVQPRKWEVTGFVISSFSWFYPTYDGEGFSPKCSYNSFL
jgi:hypothetical protein